MGEYANYSCADLTLYSYKNEWASQPILMEAFVPSDLVHEPGEDDPYRFIGYRTTCGAARARLDVLGCTLDRALSALSGFAESFLDRRDDPCDEFDPLPVQVPDDGFDWHEAVGVLKRPVGLMAAYGQLFDNAAMLKEHFWEIAKGGQLPFQSCNSYMVLLARTGAEHPYVSIVELEAQNPLWDLRVMLECVEPAASLVYDFTDVANYWDDEAEDKLLHYLYSGPFRRSEGVFLFTEGATDDEFIHDAFELLRADVSPLFRSFGFHGDARPERSASALARLARALASAGFDERCLFLFDNDAEGRKCLCELPMLPRNMKALSLPDSDLARNYPTFGPNGVESSSLNGRGVAIEFFLGKDSLFDSDGNLFVAQWASKAVDTYQARFSDDDKRAIQARYRRAASDAEKGGLDSVPHDWSSTEMLLDCLIDAASSLAPRVGRIPA